MEPGDVVEGEDRSRPGGSDVIGAGVSGGTLAVEPIGSATEPVLAVHGISSQRKPRTEVLS